MRWLIGPRSRPPLVPSAAGTRFARSYTSSTRSLATQYLIRGVDFGKLLRRTLALFRRGIGVDHHVGMVLHGLTFVGSLDLLLIGRWVAGVQAEEDERVGRIWQWCWCRLKMMSASGDAVRPQMIIHSWCDWISTPAPRPRDRRHERRLEGKCWSTCGKRCRHREDANEAHGRCAGFLLSAIY